MCHCWFLQLLVRSGEERRRSASWRKWVLFCKLDRIRSRSSWLTERTTRTRERIARKKKKKAKKKNTHTHTHTHHHHHHPWGDVVAEVQMTKEKGRSSTCTTATATSTTNTEEEGEQQTWNGLSASKRKWASPHFRQEQEARDDQDFLASTPRMASSPDPGTHTHYTYTPTFSLSLSQTHEKPRKVFPFPHVDQQNGESLFLGLLHRKFLPSSSKFLLSFLRVFGTCIQGCILWSCLLLFFFFHIVPATFLHDQNWWGNAHPGLPTCCWVCSYFFGWVGTERKMSGSRTSELHGRISDLRTVKR